VSEAKRLEKRAAKTQKLADKRQRRKAKVEGDENKPKKPSVFNTPVDISPALCSFLGRPAGSQESRSNVTRQINEYIKTHNLKPKGTHNISPDAKLRNLLAIKDGDVLTYFNLQRYLNVHYIKKQAVTA
jgi:chromatin remodeling complex protein RSC6